MVKSYYIKAYCKIQNESVVLNEKSIFHTKEQEFDRFAKEAYKTLAVSYPKFFKMDHLSKLAFLTADCILKDEKINPEDPSNIALLFANRASSLDTDRKHQESIQDKSNYFPSPAVFVYTLPNICLGEISIKYKLYTENSFFIFDNFQPENLMTYAKGLLDSEKAEEVLCGWVEYDEDHYESFLYLVSKEGRFEHTEDNILKLYNA